MLAGTAFDSVSEHPRWLTLAQSGPLPRPLTDTLGLLGVVALLGGVLGACTWAAGRLGGVGGAGMAGQFAPSIVPVALGYVVAHYASLLILEGQRAFIRLSDPLGIGADWLGTADREVDASLVTPAGIATLQLVAVVTGHVLGVVLAHDRAVRLFPRRAALLGQLPLLVLMVAYTCTGLLLLFAA
jgi:hypothetical protein